MKLLLQLFCTFAVILLCESIPKQHHGIRPQIVKTDSTDYKLPNYITPTSYDVLLEITKEELEKDGDGKFSGTVTIYFTLSKETEDFPIHLKDLDVESIQIELVTKSNKGPSPKASFTCTVNSTSVPSNDQHSVTCDSSLPKESHLVLTIKYTGILRSNEMYGLYRSTYNNGATTEYIAATQFETIGARRVFPCFDQPDMKASFTIRIIHPEAYTALSNQKEVTSAVNDDNSTKTTIFTPTPRMSTYLVAFVVSKLSCKDGDTKIDKKLTNTVCATNIEAVSKALDAAPKIIDAMEAVTGVTYESMNLKKFAQVALPDFKAGAMENWGLLTYRERLLLLDDTESSKRDLQNILTVTTHEISHQWFGDKITLNWWSDIFLNEGFATFFEYFTTYDEVADFDLSKQFVIEQLQKVLVTDSDSSSLPLHYEDHDDPETIDNRFDDIAYNKGGSILQMLSSIYGTQFNVALQNYMDNASGVGTLEGLLKAFEDATTKDVNLPENVNISAIMDNWFRKPGYPLLTVKQSSSDDNSTNITITQERFFNPKQEDESGTKWYVPISYATKLDDFKNVAPSQWLSEDAELSFTIENFDWFVLNNQQTGYYRVNYDEALLRKITDLLNSNITQIDKITRSALVDDQFNLAKAGFKSLGDALKFAQFLQDDDSYYSWYSALSGYDYLFKHTATSKLRDDLKNHVKDLMQTFIKSAEDSDKTVHINTLAYALAFDWACQLNHDDYLKKAKESFDNYQSNDTAKPDPNIRSSVYCYGLKQSENKSASVNFLWKKYLADDTLSSQKVEILKTIGCVEDDDLFEKYLQSTILLNEVKLQDITYVFQSVYSNGGVVTVINFIKTSYDNFINKFGVDQVVSLVNALPDFITSSKQTEELKKIKDIKNVDENVKTAVDNAVTRAEANIKLVENVEKSLTDFFGEDNNSAVTNGFLVLNLLLILGVYLFV